MVRLYFAARFKRAEELRGMRDSLEATGEYKVTSSWLVGTDGSEKDHDIASDEEKAAYAIRDLHDLEQSDALVYFGPFGRHAGSVVEMGYALGAGKQVICIGPKENVFHWLPNLIHFETPAEFVNAFVGAANHDNGLLHQE